MFIFKETKFILLTTIDKLYHIKNLFILGKSDGELHENEINIISQIAKKQNLTALELSLILNEETNIPFILPESFITRLSMLYDSVLLMVSDFKIHQNEKLICIDLAKKFEFNPQIIDRLIDDILKYIIEGKECNEVIDYLTKYVHPKETLN
ncbi:hypothetical protein [Chishuiella sp.]|uniref:hypothetical protein n=1 Tax=Chishuiella sp. TaxID=1969467 RepID=UPI0028A59755|nr:hypothetical protein [Chishuiella sp.]